MRALSIILPYGRQLNTFFVAFMGHTASITEAILPKIIGGMFYYVLLCLGEKCILCGLQISLKISSHQYKREEVVWAHA